jgi:uncharacterized repeat protein (TIGR01451 family)
MRLSARAACRIYVAALAVLATTFGASPVGAQVVINEIDYDMPGAGDSAEFVELKNTGAGAVNLSGYTLEMVNGNGGGAAVYDTIILPNVSLAAGGYYVICANAATVVNCDLDDAPDTDFIQNGAPDAVALRLSGTLVDTVSYEGNTGAPYTEGTGATPGDAATAALVGISRFTDGVDTNNNNADLSARCVTPGTANIAATAGCTAPPALPRLSINDVALNEGNAGTTNFAFTVTLAAPAPAGGVTFDIATADGTAQDDNPPTEDNDYVPQALVGQTIAAGNTTYNFTVLVNGDAVTEPNETFFVNVTNVIGTGVTVADGQGLGTITNDEFVLSFIHDVQGNGAATPIPGSVVQVEGVVVGNFQGTAKLSGFFLEEENADHDADPATSEGIFVFCNLCPTPVTEGQRVRVTGTVSEFFNATEITASTAGAVVVTEAGDHLAEVTPAPIDLPVVGVVDDFYEAREGMKVTFTDTLTVSEYFELARFGQIELYEGGRPRQFTETTTPSVAGYNAHLAALARRRVILDDDDNVENVSLLDANGSQFVFLPRANGGFGVGTQGTDFFRGGDLVNGLTGVLDWSFAGFTGTDAWRIRPTSANPAAFTVANPRPASPPAVGGAIKAVGMNLLNYFTTIDTTAGSTGPCGPGGTLDCRGADSAAELNRQRARASIVICTLNADVYGFGELENTASASITDLLGAVNTLCGGAHPYAFVNTGGTLGSDAIRVQLIYRTGVLSPVGSPLSDLDAIHSRPPTAQTFDVVDATSPAFGQRFTVIANHFKSKGSSAGLPGDADAGDGAGASNATRTAQAVRLLSWVNSTVLPAAGDPDVLLLGDFNSYAAETPVTTITGGGYTDLESALLGPEAYSYVFDGQLGHLDYAFSSASLTPQVTGIAPWHINADEADLLDYNDEIKDTGEAAFEEKPDGSALVPPRVLFQPSTPYRASDHDPVLVGLFAVADLSITKTDGVTTATPGGSVTYTIVASNAGPEAAPVATVADTFVAALTCNWTCVGAGGATCSASGSGSFSDGVNLPVGGSVTYTASCTVSGSASGNLVNTATVTAGGGAGDPSAANNSATDTDSLAPAANVGITKTDGATIEVAGTPVTYTIVVANAGPSPAASVTVVDNFAAALSGCSTTCVASGGSSCAAGPVAGNLSDVASLLVGGTATYTATCNISPSASGSLVNTASATVGGGVPDPNTANNSATDTDTIDTMPFIDGFETGDTSRWTLAVPLTFEAYRTVAVTAGSSDVGFIYDFAAAKSGEALAATPIAFALDGARRPLFVVGARRLHPEDPLELNLEVVGGVASNWIPAGEVGQQVQLEWSASDLGSGHVAVWLDGRLALWVDGYGGATPSGALLLRAPAPVAP